LLNFALASAYIFCLAKLASLPKSFLSGQKFASCAEVTSQEKLSKTTPSKTATATRNRQKLINYLYFLTH